MTPMRLGNLAAGVFTNANAGRRCFIASIKRQPRHLDVVATDLALLGRAGFRGRAKGQSFARQRAADPASGHRSKTIGIDIAENVMTIWLPKRS